MLHYLRFFFADNRAMLAAHSQQGAMMAEKNKPDARAYVVREGAGKGKGFWSRIGAAWMHKDGKGFNLQLDALPVDGRLVVRAITAKGETLDPESGEVKDSDEIPF